MGRGTRSFACCNELYEHLPVVEGYRALRSIGADRWPHVLPLLHVCLHVCLEVVAFSNPVV